MNGNAKLRALEIYTIFPFGKEFLFLTMTYYISNVHKYNNTYSIDKFKYYI